MRHLKRRLLLVLVSLLCLACACGKGEIAAPPSPAQPSDTPQPSAAGSDAAANEKTASSPSLTLMVYMVGSNLESDSGAATSDMEEMAASGFDTSNANLVLLTGGSQQWYSNVPADKNALLRFTGDGFVTDESWELRSMGDPALLSDFLNHCYTQYPADSYALIFWDHGAGPVDGFGRDKLFRNDAMTLEELRTAFKNSPFTGENKLEWIGFDACLMSSVELMTALDDHARYMIASEELEPYFGWNYAFLGACAPGADGAAAGGAIIDHYMDACRNYFAERPRYTKDVTLCCMDLSWADSLSASLGTLFAAMRDDLGAGAYSAIAQLRSNTKRVQAASDSSYDLVDLGGLLSAYEKAYPVETAKVRAIFEQMTVRYEANVTDLSGVSLWFPFENKADCAPDLNTYSRLDVPSGYAGFLDSFSTVLLDESALASWNTDGNAMLETGVDGGFRWKLTEEQAANFSGAVYYILERHGEEYVLLWCSRDVTLGENNYLTANYDGTTIAIVDESTGENHYGLTLQSELTEQSATYMLTGLVEIKTSNFGFSWDMESVRLRIREDRRTGKLELLDATTLGDEDDAGKTTFELTDEKNVSLELIYISNYLAYDKDGLLLPFFDWTDSGNVWIDTLDPRAPMHAERVALPPSQTENAYFCQIVAADTQGNRYASALLPIEAAVRAPAPESIPSAAMTGYVRPDAVEAVFTEGAQAPVPIYSDENVSLSLLSAYSDGYSLLISGVLENRFDAFWSFFADALTVNGCRIKTSTLATCAEPGVPVLCEMNIPLDALALAGVTNVDEIAFQLSAGISSYSPAHACFTPTIRMKTDLDVSGMIENRTQYGTEAYLGPTAEETPLFDMDGVSCALVALGGDGNGNTILTLRAENHAEIPVDLRLDGLSANQKMLDAFATTENLLPGQICYFTAKLYARELAAAGVDAIGTLGFTFSIRCKMEGETLKYYPPSVVVKTSAADTVVIPPVTGKCIIAKDGVRVTVTDFARIENDYGAPVYRLSLCVENGSPYTVQFCATDTQLNGAAYDAAGTALYISGLNPGVTVNAYMEFSLAALERAGIAAIDSISAKLYIKNTDDNAYLFTPKVLRLH